MAKKTSSFHMSNEFNGHGQNTYLSATQYNSYASLPQTDIRLTRDFGQSIQKALGGLAVMIYANPDAGMLLKALGGVSAANQVIIGKNAATGQYTFSYNVSSINEFSNDSYLLAASKGSTQSVFMNVPYGWNPFTSMGRWKWGQVDGTYKKEGWLKVKGKWYYFEDYWMLTGWQEIKSDSERHWYYFISEKDIAGMEQKGHMALGWIKIKGLWYYLKEESEAGYMVTGWREINGKWYYFKTKEEAKNGTDYGYMFSDTWLKYKGIWYYFDKNGEMITSKLITWKGKKYFLKADGSMAVNETVVDPITNKTYKADKDGVCREIKNGVITIALSDSARFVEILDGSTKYYGGDQEWYNWSGDTRKTNIARQGGCGTVASANMVAYLADHNSKYKGLYAYSDYTKANFLLHMEDMYEYVTPGNIGDNPLGVWPISMMERGVEEFASDKGIELNAVRKGGTFSRENITEYIKEGLEKDSPVAMLIGARKIDVNFTRPGGMPSQSRFQLHWVTITELIIDETNDKVKVKVSSWGGWAEVDLDEYLQEPLYQGLLYFE